MHIFDVSMKVRPRIHFQTSKSTLDSLKSVINVFRRKPLLGAPEMNVLWKVFSENLTSGKNPSEIHEASSLSYYRNNYYKAQQRSIVRSIFCRFNWDVAFRPRFIIHAYVVSVYVGAPESIVFQMANVSISYRRRKFACLTICSATR